MVTRFHTEHLDNSGWHAGRLMLGSPPKRVLVFVVNHEVNVTNSSRRQFLGISARTAGKVAATGLVSLPLLASMSKKADALGWTGWHDDPSPGHNNGGNGGGSGRCFLRGTQIQTPDGEMAVEELKIGTLVDTLRGPMPVKWIGRQSFAKSSPAWHWSVTPIRVARFALSDQYPRRDLFLSPHHSLFIDGLLIPVQWLVNGKTITLADMDDRDSIEYFHIELETHEVVFAEGTPAETLLVDNGREHFGNFIQYEELYGARNEEAMQPFAPRLEYNGVSGELNRLLRSAVSPVVDVRDPIQKARARFAARSERVFG